MYIPFICLSDSCEITDISPTMKPFPDVKNGKGFLRRVFGKDISERVEELCRDGRRDGSTLLELPCPIGIFKTLAAVRYPVGGLALYLLSTREELCLVLKDRARRTDGHLPSVAGILSAADIPTDLPTLASMCSRVSSTLTTLTLSTSISSDDSILPDGGAALLFVCCALIRAVADTADGEIEMSFSGAHSAFGITLSVPLSVPLSLAGHGDELMLLAPFLKGSRAYLRCAVLGARQSQLSLNAEIRDGRLCFHIGSFAVNPPPEFKSPARENAASETLLCDTVCFILSSAEALSAMQEQ